MPKLPLFSRNKKDQENSTGDQKTMPVWLIAATWVIAFLMIALLGFSLYQYLSCHSLLAFIKLPLKTSAESQAPSVLPDFAPTKALNSVTRSTDPQTVLPTGSRKDIIEYQVESGDTLFGLAKEYSLEPESILWANFTVLHDNPHLISLGVTLKIPPQDGILYQWKEGDKLDHIAGLYKVDVQDILLYPGNDLDITNPVIEPGTFIMIPGGYRELEQSWIVPMDPGSVTGGTTAKINGPGSCTPAGVYYGNGAFGWPAPYPAQASRNHHRLCHP